MTDIMKQFKKVKTILGSESTLQLTDEENLRYQDVLYLLVARGYLLDLKVNGTNLYHKMADWDGFEDWLNEEIKEEKRVTRREWAIGIVCTIIGAAIGLIPYIVSLGSAS